MIFKVQTDQIKKTGFSFRESAQINRIQENNSIETDPI